MSVASEYATQIAEIAIMSIASGLENGSPFKPALSELPEALRQKNGCFVALYKDGVCCGCMGNLISDECLAIDIANSAFNAAYADPRYPVLTAESILDGDIEVEISVLSNLEAIKCSSDNDLQFQINSDNGLLLVDGDKDASFLPQMWNMYPDKGNFVAALKAELGYNRDYWSNTMKFFKFTAEMITSEIPLDEYYNSLNNDKE